MHTRPGEAGATAPDGALRPRARKATTGPDGRAVAVADARQLGPPGLYEIVVSYGGSDRYDAARITATLEVTAAATSGP